MGTVFKQPRIIILILSIAFWLAVLLLPPPAFGSTAVLVAEKNMASISPGKSYRPTVRLKPAQPAQLPASTKELGGQELGAAPDEGFLGAPRRILNEAAATQVRIYGDYSRFTLLCVNAGKVVYIYVNYAEHGQEADKLFTDSIGGNQVYAAARGSIPALDNQATEQIFFELTNAFRSYHGLSALRWNDTLAQAARRYCQSMAQLNFFGHQSPDGSTTSSRLKQAGYEYTSCAENIAAGFDNAFEPFDELVNSAIHRSNLLTASCDETGIGWTKAEQSKYTYYATQLFGKI